MRLYGGSLLLRQCEGPWRIPITTTKVSAVPYASPESLVVPPSHRGGDLCYEESGHRACGWPAVAPCRCRALCRDERCRRPAARDHRPATQRLQDFSAIVLASRCRSEPVHGLSERAGWRAGGSVQVQPHGRAILRAVRTTSIRPGAAGVVAPWRASPLPWPNASPRTGARRARRAAGIPRSLRIASSLFEQCSSCRAHHSRVRGAGAPSPTRRRSGDRCRRGAEDFSVSCHRVRDVSSATATLRAHSRRCRDLVCLSSAWDERLLATCAFGDQRACRPEDDPIVCRVGRYAGGAVRMARSPVALGRRDDEGGRHRAASPNGGARRRGGRDAPESRRSRIRLMRRAEPPDLGTDRGDRPSIGDRSSASVQAAQLRTSDGAYLSVVVPVWNGAARLSRTLYALHGLLLRQGYPTELTIVDDCR